MYGTAAIPHIEKWRSVPYYIEGALRGASTSIIVLVTISRGFMKKKWEGYNKL